MKTLFAFLLLTVTALADSTATVANGIPVTFSVAVAQGAQPFTYQWQKNGVNIAGATAATLIIPKAAVADSGTYDVVVSNKDGLTVSDKGLLTVNAPIIPPNPPAQATVKISF